MFGFRRTSLSAAVVVTRFYSSKQVVPLSRVWTVRYEAEGRTVPTEEGAKALPVIPAVVPVDVVINMTRQWDVSWNGLKILYKQCKLLLAYNDQRFIPERLAILGPDLAAAHFIVHRGGGVRLGGQNKWVRKDENDEYFLPRKYVADVTVEAIDLYGVPILYEGMINLVNLRGLRWLSFRGCENVDDWFCDWLGRYGTTLEYLDIGGCKKVTDAGVAVFHRLRNLKTLIVDDLPNFKHQKLVCLLLKDVIPDCQIIGVGTVIESLSLDSTQANQRIADS